MKHQNNTFFSIFSCCRIIKGSSQSIICDLQRDQYFKVPNDLVDILSYSKKVEIKELYFIYGKENSSTLDDYFRFLIENEIIFFASPNQLESFTDLEMNWDYPGYITNAILEISNFSNYDVGNTIYQLEDIGCGYIQLRFLAVTPFKFIEKIVTPFITTKMSFEVLMPFCDELADKNFLIKKIEGNLKFTKIVIYNSPFTEFEKSAFDSFSYLEYVEENIGDHKFCGTINERDMFSNLFFVSEAMSYNSCLNRKISVNNVGDIKNCPSLKESYGNINHTSIFEVLEEKQVKKLWSLTKDQVSICKFCEYRYMCMDCRAYLEDPEDIFSKPLKCGYNPYTCEWEEWSTNPLKQKAIEYYGMQELVKKETE